VLPSEIEGLSTGLLEAMSYGNCVLVSDIKANLEAIESNGLSFQTGNLEDLQTKLSLLLEQGQLVQEYKQKISEYMKTYCDWNAVTDQMEQLYFSVMNKTKVL